MLRPCAARIFLHSKFHYIEVIAQLSPKFRNLKINLIITNNCSILSAASIIESALFMIGSSIITICHVISLFSDCSSEVHCRLNEF